MELIRNFTGLGKNDANIAGGKGASLGEMTQAGIPVPPGFVILTAAFERFLDETNLNQQIQANLDQVNQHEMQTIEDASQKIQNLILNSQIPEDIKQEILKDFNQLNCEFVAVRSSATAEDGANASWAGELDSFLNTTKETVLENVRRCWASLFTPRAIFYRIEKGFDKGKVSVAVVVQKMVNSDISGIAFSVHPVTEDPNQLIIEAGFGLGEAIVSGSITPDNYVVDKRNWEIVDSYIAQQEKKLIKKTLGGSEWVDVGPEKQEQQKLPNEKVIELAKLVTHIENHYGFPCDIEWAMEDDVIYIVQSRPITTLTQNQEDSEKKVEIGTNKFPDNSKWFKLLSREGVDLTTISQIDLVFYDLIWQTTGKKEELFFTHLKNKHFTHYIGIDPREVGRYTYKKYLNNPEQIVNYYEKGKELLNEIKKETTEWSEKLKTGTPNELLLSAFKDFRKSFEEISSIYSIVSWIGIEFWQSDFEDLLNKMIAREGLEKRTEEILSVIYKPWKKTALIEIQEKLEDGIAPEKLAEEYQFLRSWSAVWYKPITADWVKSIQNTAITNNTESQIGIDVTQLLKPNAEEEKFIQLAPYIVFFKDWRDDVRRIHAYEWSFLFDRISETFGINRDDIGYLTLNEIDELLSSNKIPSELIKIRQENGCIATIEEQDLKIKVIESNIPSNYTGVIESLDKTGEDKNVKGTIAQKGKIRGYARVIRSYHDIKRVKEGDILIANTTHPNYLPAMQKAAAIVTNEGGMISHAAIVARELHKPCVVGTQNATRILKDGDLVEVDADNGIVRKIMEKNG